MVNKKNDYKIKCRIWIEKNNATFLAQGRIELLSKIKEYGSINKAAKAMDMSYRKAWQMINAMNLDANSPLVVKTSGGKGGGGTLLTTNGEKLLVIFETLQHKYTQLLKQEIDSLDFDTF